MQPNSGDRRRVVRHTSTAVLRHVVHDAIAQAIRDGLDDKARTARAIAAVRAVEPEVTAAVARIIVARLRPS